MRLNCVIFCCPWRHDTKALNAISYSLCPMNFGNGFRRMTLFILSLRQPSLCPWRVFNLTKPVRQPRKFDFRPHSHPQLKPPKKHHKKWVVERKEAKETDRAKELYKKRKTTLEPVFGIIKQVLGFRQFLLRGLRKVNLEWQ